METHALFLTALAVVLAYPLPRWLARADFRLRSPSTAMLLWQAIALAGGLSMVGAPIVFGLAPFGETVPEALATCWRLLIAADFAALTDLHARPVHVFSLCLGTLLGIHLLLTLLRTYVRVLGARRRHRDLVRLLSAPSEAPPPADGEIHGGRGGTLPDDALIIDHDAPLAYCLPGRRNADSVTVLSRGLLDQLSPGEIAAVINHETTHLRQHHHLLTMAFDAWYRALPWLPTTRYGRQAVLELTEMLADDGALRASSRVELLRSLATTAMTESASMPEARRLGAPAEPATAASDPAAVTGPRLSRLLSPPVPLGLAARTAVVVLAAALLAVPTALMALP